jgi:hypothetical protein
MSAANDALKHIGMQIAIDAAGDDIPPTTKELIHSRRTGRRKAQAEVDEARMDLQQFAPDAGFNGRIYRNGESFRFRTDDDAT